MGIWQLTPLGAIEDFLNDRLNKGENAIVNALCYIGELCFAEARLNGSYHDRTGNLRNSIGYVVVQDGRIITEDASNPETKKLLHEKASEFSKGIVLIVAAGMNYSAFVEAMGYNVITSSELLAERLAPRIMKQLGFTLK